MFFLCKPVGKSPHAIGKSSRPRCWDMIRFSLSEMLQMQIGDGYAMRARPNYAVKTNYRRIDDIIVRMNKGREKLEREKSGSSSRW